MKMKKYLSIAILLMMMSSPAVFTSCGNDDLMEKVESPETKLDVWTEPYHIMGANVDEIESYMAQSMKHVIKAIRACVNMVRSHIIIMWTPGLPSHLSSLRIMPTSQALSTSVSC